MAEVITETIIPGTYIEVRAEGLLTIGAISTGNVGVIGTAAKGNSKIEILSSFDEGRAKFGNQTPWDPNADGSNLTLVRSLKFLFDNGARTVYAQRVFDENSAKTAAYTLNKNSSTLLKLKAKTPGTWGNQLQIRIEEGENQELVSNELVKRKNGNYTLSAEKILQPQTDEEVVGNITVREQGLTKKYQLKRAQASGSVVQVNPSDRTLTFATPPPAAAEIRANYWVPKENLRKITLKYDNFQEVYIVPSAYYLDQVLTDENNPSKLVEVEEVVGQGLPSPTTRFEGFSGGENGSVTLNHYKDALEKLVDKNIQIVVVSGPKFSEIKSALVGHVEKTENLGRERMAVIGADKSEVEKILENANEVADKRVILVAPGLKQKDPQNGRMIDLPPYFAAAAVAGKMSSLSPHVSLTNKTLAAIDDLAVEYNYGQMKSLLENRVLALQKKRGIRVVKGITTHDEAYKQITLRRIIDYIKEGTRRGANQYIGKLNNARVRGALHTTLNGFLTDMVTREFLTGYKLNVFADRAMEIRGEVQVIMDLNPTFSIDVIRVIMNLS
ncbi:MAG: phage tail sheath subtilisin-like domain-containing protein [Candidatus Aminicenantes bacterium]|nr:MAG: phage tail sheath subtilisin-like domain-containing protein [Candidatus Aminicenantes bacterium]